MEEHHRRAIERLTERFESDPAYPALIIGGSVAKGLNRPNSDIDFILVTTDEEFRRHQESHELTYYDESLCDYPGGYVDGKFVDMQFLEVTAERGNEPTRWSFLHSFIAYSRIPGLEGLLARIPVYQDREQPSKIRSFFTQLVVSNWYVGEAEKQRNLYLLSHFASNLVLFGGRLVLAHNRMLYPYHKWLMHELEQAPDKPANLIPLAMALLEQPSARTAGAFHDCIRQFRDWGMTDREAFRRFTEETERNWLAGKAALDEW